MVATAASSEAFRPTYEATGCLNQEQHAIAQAVSNRPIVEDSRVRFNFSPFEKCTGKHSNVIQAFIFVLLFFRVGIITLMFHTYLHFYSIDACVV